MAARRRPVVWTPSAQAALDGALEYIAQESPEGAQRVLHATLDLATSLETLSERGRIVPELDDPSVREVFVYSYRLIYEVRGVGGPHNCFPSWSERLRSLVAGSDLKLGDSMRL